MEESYDINFLKISHKGSSSHKSEILGSKLCGCFYCQQRYLPSEINEWINDINGETAICPKCGIDAVLSSEYPIEDNKFLDEMNRYWF
ncbi:hypothetical protein SAMN05661044_01139 [Olivibacter domesticus]|uniref:Cytoplasmic protein n=1 Tax=Olivibacter domesticus TaxID=407022 RepID=A0A1H7JV69_OLID1|nr:hypothetical protein SAMN05661044_01139 [Olivibacter domesticus]